MGIPMDKNKKRQKGSLGYKGEYKKASKNPTNITVTRRGSMLLCIIFSF